MLASLEYDEDIWERLDEWANDLTRNRSFSINILWHSFDMERRYAGSGPAYFNACRRVVAKAVEMGWIQHPERGEYVLPAPVHLV